MNHGEMIRSFRKAKKISRKKLSEGIHSERNLSRFENDNSYINVDTFLTYLDRLNIQPEEYFFHLQHNSTNSKELLLKELDRVTNVDELENLIEKITKKYKQTKDEFYALLESEAKILFSRKFPSKTSFSIDKDVQRIRDYLDNLDNFGFYEAKLFSKYMIHFDEKFVDSHLSTTHSFLKEMNFYERYKKESFILLLNYANYYYQKENKDKLTLVINSLKRYLATCESLYGSAYFMLFNELLHDKTGEDAMKLISPFQCPKLLDKFKRIAKKECFYIGE